MGKTHSRHGLAVGITLSYLITALAVHPAAAQLAVTLAVIAGSLAPDLDDPGSTIAHTFGPASHLLARVVHRSSAILYGATATHRDLPRGGGHRGITHTLVFAVAVGLGSAVALAHGGLGMIAGWVFITASLTIRGLAGRWARHTGWVGVILAAAAITVALVLFGHVAAVAGLSGWLGLGFGVGCLTHDLGDSWTVEGAPILWPIRIRGQRWHLLGAPHIMRFRTGKGVETRFVAPASLVVALGVGALAVATVVRPALLRHL